MTSETEQPIKTTCEWIDKDGDMQKWKTGCNELWVLDYETPKDHGMVFCPVCGERIEVKDV